MRESRTVLKEIANDPFREWIRSYPVVEKSKDKEVRKAVQNIEKRKREIKLNQLKRGKSV
jgi:hypothetical protein